MEIWMDLKPSVVSWNHVRHDQIHLIAFEVWEELIQRLSHGLEFQALQAELVLIHVVGPAKSQ
jgi:hypothetical protein